MSFSFSRVGTSISIFSLLSSCLLSSTFVQASLPVDQVAVTLFQRTKTNEENIRNNDPPNKMIPHVHFPKEYERQRYQNLHRRQNKKFNHKIHDDKELEDFLHLYSGEETEEALFRIIGGNQFGYRKGASCHENKNYIQASEASLPIIDYFSPGAKYTLISGVNGLSMNKDNTPLLHNQILEHEKKLVAKDQEEKQPENQYHFHVEHGYSFYNIVDMVLDAMSEEKVGENKAISENEDKIQLKKRFHHIISNSPKNREYAKTSKHESRPSSLSDRHTNNILPSDIPLNVDQIEDVLSMTSNTLSNIKINEIFELSVGTVDRIFLQELQAVFNLPSYIQLQSSSLDEFESHLLFVTVDSLNELKEKYGDYSEQVALATKMIDVAFTYLYLELSAFSKNDFISGFISTLPSISSISGQGNKSRQNKPLHNTVRSEDYVYEGQTITEEFQQDIRHLAAGQSVTPAEMENVNMICWTTVILIVITYMAVMVMAGSGNGPKDPILYAKFQADTGN